VRELLDVTHHLFEGGSSSLLAISSGSLRYGRRKRIVYLVTFSAFLLDTGMPWLTRFVSPAFAPVHVATTAILGTMYGVLIAVPLHEMWWAFDKEEQYDWARPAETEDPRGTR
jgi:hypothetical protein